MAGNKNKLQPFLNQLNLEGKASLFLIFLKMSEMSVPV